MNNPKPVSTGSFSAGHVAVGIRGKQGSEYSNNAQRRTQAREDPNWSAPYIKASVRWSPGLDNSEHHIFKYRRYRPKMRRLGVTPAIVDRSRRQQVNPPSQWDWLRFAESPTESKLGSFRKMDDGARPSPTQFVLAKQPPSPHIGFVSQPPFLAQNATAESQNRTAVRLVISYSLRHINDLPARRALAAEMHFIVGTNGNGCPTR
jgi:hypothetical protein